MSASLVLLKAVCHLVECMFTAIIYSNNVHSAVLMYMLVPCIYGVSRQFLANKLKFWIYNTSYLT